MVLHNGSHWRIEGIAARNAALGVFLRYFKHLGAEAVTVENCDFTDMDSWLIDAAIRGYEWAIPAAVWVGGAVPSGAGEVSTVLDGLTIRNCAAENCTAGFGTGWYFPALHRARLNNLFIEDCRATRVSIGGLALNSVSNGIIRRFRTFKKCGKPGGFIWGSTGGIISTSENVTFEDCEFSDTDRMWPDRSMGDGSGFDIDGNNHNIVMRRCLFHDNEGPGLLFLSTYGIQNTSTLIEDCTFWNNATDASDDTFAPGGNAYEIKISGGAASGVIRNCGLHRSSAATGWIDAGIQNTVSFENPRLGWWSALEGRPVTPAWEWNAASTEGWNGWNQWTPVVSDGQLSGVSSGSDLFGQSPLLWSNTLRSTPLVRLRLRAESGNSAQLFFITEHDSQWNGAKSVGIPLIADGNWHDYTVDLRASPRYTGVITRVRIDPTDAAGASFGVDHMRVRPVLEDIRPTVSGMAGKGVSFGFSSDPGAAFLLMRSSDLQHWSHGFSMNPQPASRGVSIA